MNRYELTYIIDTALEETARKELIEKVSALIAANGGEVEKVDEEPWGKGAKRLAYPINYKTEGWYVLVTFKAPADLPRELERNLEIRRAPLSGCEAGSQAQQREAPRAQGCSRCGSARGSR